MGNTLFIVWRESVEGILLYAWLKAHPQGALGMRYLWGGAAAGLLVGGVEKMIGYDWIPALADPVWDSSFLLDDNATVGNLVATLTGYRSHPALTLVLAYAAYWALLLGWPQILKSTADERR